MKIRAFVSVVGIVLTCSCKKAQQQQAVVGGVAGGVCILNHVNEPPAQIAVDCGVASVADVVKVIDAHRAAMVREGYVLRPVDGGMK